MNLHFSFPFSRTPSAAPRFFLSRCLITTKAHRKAEPVRRRAKRCSALPPGLEKWAPLAVDDKDDDGDDGDDVGSHNGNSCLTTDPDYRANLDDLCTRALRAMLKGDVDSLKPGSPWADDVSALGNYCVAQTPQPHLDGARFAFFLLEIAANRWPREADDLVGVYKEAAEKIHGVLENSGWRLALPGEKEDAGQGVAGGYDEE